VILAWTEDECTIVVSRLLSSEYPIEVMVWLEQVEPFADSENGDVTVALFAGVVTTTDAKAGPATDRSKNESAN
jgi:hypothetical protein